MGAILVFNAALCWQEAAAFATGVDCCYPERASVAHLATLGSHIVGSLIRGDKQPPPVQDVLKLLHQLLPNISTLFLTLLISAS
jgi:hypothetical protein